MKAVVIREHGGLDVLRWEEMPEPAPGPGQLKVRVAAAGCNFADTLMAKGTYQDIPGLPFSPGMELAGEVLAVGEGVTIAKPGQRVMARVSFGAFAEIALCDEIDTTVVPDAMEDVTAAGFPIVYGTSHVALTHRCPVYPGEVMLVHGAAGGVGLTAVEIGKALGATVVATAGSDDKLEVAKQYGADYLVNYRTEDIREKVKEYVGGVDVVYDPVGGDTFKASLRCINHEGRIIIVGFAGGEVPQIPANILLVKNCSAVGFYWGSYRKVRPDVHRRSYDALVGLFNEGKLKPHVSHVLPMQQAADALQLLLDRKSTGKVVLTNG